MERKRVVFLTNYPSPYRVQFWSELGKDVDLTVLFTESPKDQTHRAKEWFEETYENFNAVFLQDKIKITHSKYFFKDVFSYVKPSDLIILGGYSSLTQMLMIEYLRMRRIAFYLEVDGGLIRDDSRINYLIKKHFISSASGWFSSGVETTKYLIHYGARKENVYLYPFTSLWERDVLKKAIPYSEKIALREKLSLTKNKMVLCVGNFIPRKGMDILIRAAALMSKDIKIYIVGGIPSQEYIDLKAEMDASNVEFVGFQVKETLKKYYQAADLFVFPTREDIWGLVVGEALANGLPVVTTNRCVAGLELIRDGENGYIVPVENPGALACAVEKALSAELEKWEQNALLSVENRTIENMVKRHLEIFNNISAK